MSRSSPRREPEKHVFSYMDNVPVKISEQYKPPRKVVLPVGYQHRLPVERVMDELQYDFKLENSVLNKLEEWKRSRKEAAELRKDRIKAREAAVETKLVQQMEHFSFGTRASDTNAPVSPVPFSNPPTEGVANVGPLTSSILTPIPISQAPTNILVSKLPSQFNFSDFEADTSSPFDNMALKTINDMEELASVLQPYMLASVQGHGASEDKKELGVAHPANGLTSNYASIYATGPRVVSHHHHQHDIRAENYHNVCEGGVDQAYNARYYSAQSWPTPVQVERLDYGGAIPSQQEVRPQSRSVPDIVRELERDLLEKRGEAAWPSSSNSSAGSADSAAADPLTGLPINAQRLCRHISEMGFTLSRVVRACQHFNQDDKKMVEFLLLVQSLEEKGFPGDRAEKAVVVCDYNVSEAERHLEAMAQLLDLGFSEDRVSKALLACGNDRDKALELLIS